MNPLIESLNAATSLTATQTLQGFCGSPFWVAQMCDARPYFDAASLHDAADQAFKKMSRENWLAAFAHHPKIGDMESLKAKFAGNSEWSGDEQAGINKAAEATLVTLAKGNEDYESRFGHIFIVCATGKTAAEMLELLQARQDNEPDVELVIAAAEQKKITHLRINKWLDPSD